MKVLITGVTGQDGSYLAEHLVATGSKVFGLVRSTEHHKSTWLKTLVPSIQLVVGDLLDQSSLERVLYDVQPDEMYNLAAVTSPGGSWGAHQPPLMAEVTALSVIRILDTLRITSPRTRLVHASSSAIYAAHKYGLYGAAKKFAHDVVSGYRDGYGLHASNAVFFSHTSPRQQNNFLIRMLIKHVVNVAAGRQSLFQVTNVSNKRDWGFAPDYVKALPMIARMSTPRDYDICTGKTHSVREVIDAACATVDISWRDVSHNWKSISYVSSDVEFPGNSLLTYDLLGWSADTSFTDMIKLLVKAELIN